MPNLPRDVQPGPHARTVRAPDGAILPVPDGWELLPPGDALLTRRVKAGGPCWTVTEKVGRRQMSRGVWAPAERIDRARRSVDATRSSPEHARTLATGRARREREQRDYVVDFERHVVVFLAFHATHADLARALAARVAAHATPVGSGTVARTQRIPVAERAEAAVIAWLRHQTTAYDHMNIPRVKGMRRDVRRQLAARSRDLLDRYRRGLTPAVDCPLARALAAPAPAASTATQAAPRPRHAPATKPPPRAQTAAPTAEAPAPTMKPAPTPARASPAPATRPAPHAPSPASSADEMDRRAARQRALRERLRGR